MCKTHRLSAYGIAMHVLCISAEICLGNEVNQQLNVAMANIHASMRARKVEQLKAGTFKATKKKMYKRGIVAWADMCSQIRARPFHSLLD